MLHQVQREFFIDNLLVRMNFIIVMIRWTGLAPWEFEFPFPGSFTSTFLGHRVQGVGVVCGGGVWWLGCRVKGVGCGD